ncbi:MAG: type II secretion system protein, partial [Candidatus Thioglobus sp.]
MKFDNGLKKKTSQLGFTLIEAIISLLVFGISFAGLFLLFGIAQQTAINAEKRMFLNLMANRIVENIANEGANVSASINPFD